MHLLFLQSWYEPAISQQCERSVEAHISVRVYFLCKFEHRTTSTSLYDQLRPNQHFCSAMCMYPTVSYLWLFAGCLVQFLVSVGMLEPRQGPSEDMLIRYIQNFTSSRGGAFTKINKVRCLPPSPLM